MIAAAVKHAGIGDVLDHVLTVEDVGVFKPARVVYQLAVDRLGVSAAAIAFQSSNAWDIHAASAFGLHTVWCNRTKQRRERLPGAPDREIATLAELPGLLGV
jgi:2-haloacid dehalogenase